jgi:hypothetical protein
VFYNFFSIFLTNLQVQTSPLFAVNFYVSSTGIQYQDDSNTLNTMYPHITAALSQKILRFSLPTTNVMGACFR